MAIAGGVTLRSARFGAAAPATGEWQNRAAEDDSPLILPPDFTTTLRTGPSDSALLERLSRACAEAGISLTSVQMAQRPASADALGRIEVNASLRGPYVATKRTIEQIVERYDASTVALLRMRRGTQPNEIETTLAFAVWSPPVREPPRLAPRLAAEPER